MSDPQLGPIRLLPVDEQFTWGTCPICDVGHGTKCVATGNEQRVTTMGGQLGDGVHISRLRLSTSQVREVAA